MKLNMEHQLSKEFEQKLDSLTDMIDIEIVQARKDLKRAMIVNLAAKGVALAAVLGTVLWISRDTTV
jgi:hypothetical protein